MANKCWLRSVSRALVWWSTGPGFNPHWRQYFSWICFARPRVSLCWQRCKCWQVFGRKNRVVEKLQRDCICRILNLQIIPDGPIWRLECIDVWTVKINSNLLLETELFINIAVVLNVFFLMTGTIWTWVTWTPGGTTFWGKRSVGCTEFPPKTYSFVLHKRVWWSVPELWSSTAKSKFPFVFSYLSKTRNCVLVSA